LKEISTHIPQSDWGENIRVFFAPSSYTNKMAEDKILFKFKSAKITFEQIQSKRDQIIIKDLYSTRMYFTQKNVLTDATLIYSMWEGYLHEVEPFWDKYKVPIVKIHTSGHAYIEELQKFVKAINPTYIIPNHTFFPEKYLELFGAKTRIINDKETVEI
jgi:ribonuclease J